MSPAGTGGLAKVTSEACAQQHAMGPTMTPGIGEITNFFEGTAIPHYFRVSFTFMLPLIIDSAMRGPFHSNIIVTLITQHEFHNQFMKGVFLFMTLTQLFCMNNKRLWACSRQYTQSYFVIFLLFVY